MHDETLNARSFAKRGELIQFGWTSELVYLMSYVCVSRFSCSLASERQVPRHIWSQRVLPYMPDEPDAHIQPPLQLPPIPRRTPVSTVLRIIVYVVLTVSRQDPEYSRLYAQLPAYRASLETRYPPICASCLPAVEEEIKRRDRMAKTSALGTLLKQSKGKGKERQRQASGSISQPQRASLERELLVWRIRGMLWAVTLLCAVSCYGSGE